MEKRSLRDYLIITVKGMGMGAADVVPGVSGGTIAFITGIYQELIDSIKGITPQKVLSIFKDGWSKFAENLNLYFLVALVGGIFVSVLSLAKVIHHLLETYPIAVWSFFFGLIVSSALFIGKKVTQWNVANLGALLVGAAIAYYITVATPAETPETLPFVFLSGAIAICAMILPGISGSFILLLLGKYKFILESVKTLDIKVILVFILGCVVGILSFSRMISFLFEKYYNLTIALLTGFMIGSLNKVWPWKEVLEYRMNSKGEEVSFLDRSVLPGTYESLTGESSLMFIALGLAVIGFLVVFVFESNLLFKKEK
jgi:putative membrane protein